MAKIQMAFDLDKRSFLGGSVDGTFLPDIAQVFLGPDEVSVWDGGGRDLLAAAGGRRPVDDAPSDEKLSADIAAVFGRAPQPVIRFTPQETDMPVLYLTYDTDARKFVEARADDKSFADVAEVSLGKNQVLVRSRDGKLLLGSEEYDRPAVADTASAAKARADIAAAFGF